VSSRAQIAVIGAGPAGATAAALLASEGHEVTLFDRAPFPRHHVGESLQPAAFELLEMHLGLGERMAAAGFVPKYGAVYEWGETRERWSVLFDDRLDGGTDGVSEEDIAGYEHSWHVDRARFDQLILDEATARGAKLQIAEALDPVLGEGRVRGLRVRDDAGEREHRCDWLIDASGQRCLLGRGFDVIRTHDDLRATATYGYWQGCGGLEGPLGRGATLIVSVPNGWVWFIPITEDSTSVGLVSSEGRKVSEADYLAAVESANLPIGRGALAPDATGERLRHARNWSYMASRTAGPGWLMAGDSAGFVDPILSGGVDFAIRGGCNAALAIAKLVGDDGYDEAEVLRDYDQGLRAELVAYLRLARYWYGNNRSVDGFFWEAHRAVRADSIDTPLRAFKYLTMGRYDADRHYKVFIEWQERKIFKRLGVDKASLREAIAQAERRIYGQRRP
jgi:flavin-dependent halogenase